MFDLLQSRLSDLTLTKRRLVRLLDKTMQHDDSLGYQSTEEYAGNPLSAFQSQLKQTVTKGFGMRCSQVRAEYNHSSCEHDISRSQRIGQSQNLCLHDIAVIGNRVIHRRRVTNMLIARKIEINYPNVTLPWFGTNKTCVKETETAGVKSVPALVMNGAAFHINFGAGIDALK
jgi:hypothetical protein